MKHDVLLAGRRRVRGLMILEALLGLVLLGGIVGLFATGQRHQGRMAQTLRTQRVEMRTLEAAALRWRAEGRVDSPGVAAEDGPGGWVRLSVGGAGLWVAPRPEVSP